MSISTTNEAPAGLVRYCVPMLPGESGDDPELAILTLSEQLIARIDYLASWIADNKDLESLSMNLSQVILLGQGTYDFPGYFLTLQIGAEWGFVVAKHTKRDEVSSLSVNLQEIADLRGSLSPAKPLHFSEDCDESHHAMVEAWMAREAEHAMKSVRHAPPPASHPRIGL